MPPADPIRGTPHDWIARAESHLTLAQQPKPPNVFWEELAFHAQQAAELALKAVYQHLHLTFRFTHNLEELGIGIQKAGVPAPQALRDAVILTRYAVWTRYPGTSAAMTEEEHKEAVRLAQAVVAWARGIVGETDAP